VRELRGAQVVQGELLDFGLFRFGLGHGHPFTGVTFTR
jgi:hypothetical protein